MQTISGAPSPVRSAKVGDSLSTTLTMTWRVHAARSFVGSPGFWYQDASCPGNPMTSTSRQPSPSRSRMKVKKWSEYRFTSNARGG